MNKTQNYQLNQWEKTDKVRMEDFNADNAKIDGAIAKVAAEKASQADLSAVQAALAAMPKIATGTYAGTGEYGDDHPNTLTFPFVPKVVIIVQNSAYSSRSGTVLVAGQTQSSGIGGAANSGVILELEVQWSGNSVSWYTTSESAEKQLNSGTYFYWAMG